MYPLPTWLPGVLKGQDIRQLGDRNVGAANVYRSVGPRAGLAVGIIDIAKGAVAVLLVKALVDSTGPGDGRRSRGPCRP